MNIFDWVHDIEETYNFLIKNAKEENKAEIANYRKEQEAFLEKGISKKKAVIKSVMEKLSEDIHNGIKDFDGKYVKTLQKIEAEFNKRKKILLKSILNQLRVEF